MAADHEWWQEAVVYQIYPQSFNDSDGDGVGDIPGIVEKVDYLDDLGVDVVWLTPVYESPHADNGYDVSDYRAINPEFGTMADWERLLAELHDREMKLVMDLVVNHTSEEHDWFLSARQSPDGEYRDYYIWRDGEPGDPPNNWESAFGGSAWEYDEDSGQYYLHLFATEQPDLDWTNPEVREEVFDMMEWWFEKGIDGFRMDVINVLSKDRSFPDGDPDGDWVGGEHFVNGPRAHEYVSRIHDRVLADYDCMAVGETPGATVEDARRYLEDGLDMVFHFQHVRLDFGDDWWDVTEFSLSDLKEVTDRWQTGLADGGWNALYLENHDQPRVTSRYGDDERYRVESAKLWGTYLFTLRGTPFLFQGQELGMTNYPFASLDEVRDADVSNRVELALERGEIDSFTDVTDVVRHRSRDNARTPMQWTDEPNAGFTDGEPWIPVNPNYPEINVEAARDDPGSVWHYYRELIDLRTTHPTLIDGTFELLQPDHDQLFAYSRHGAEDFLVVLNVSPEPATFDRPSGLHAPDPELLLANYPVGDAGLERIETRPYEARVYRLSG